ncbi:hypothetical protein ACFHYQ_10395 [Sphaerimonospora cavernae]|uniref:Uncharacterized protein n=1 Tax=Sphaerimonospora cavernae TaxID=1740611 RepID=A0ABV6U4B2_9ACTN
MDTVPAVVSVHPVTALVEASAKADLGVVGSRGRGVVRPLVLGPDSPLWLAAGESVGDPADELIEHRLPSRGGYAMACGHRSVIA